MNLAGKVLCASFVSLAVLVGCSTNPSSNPEVSAESGSININLVADAASDFRDVARSAEVRISGEGMPSMTRALTITQTGISGSVSGIPAGTDRKFEVFVYDDDNKVCYYGGAFGNVSAGGTAAIALTLYRSSGEGNATITGSIEPGNTPPVVSITSPANNAQFTVGSTIAIAATASDADGSVSSVAFYRGATLLSTDNSAPYSCNFTPSTAGTYALSAVATDNEGAATTSAVVTVTVNAVPQVSYKINCGGSAVSPYGADGYYSGGNTSSTTSAINITGVTNPAPAAVYQKERYGNITYTFPSLVSGLSYNVRLHFAEIYWTASARRRFNVAINGSQVLANFDIYATAGAGKKAVVREFTATANASGQIVVAFTTVTDNASVCGIEIFPNPAQTFTITYNSNGGSGTAPVDANSYAYGSSVTIKPNSGALVSGSSSFAGWNTSGGITYACGQTITITGNLQLNAKYSENEVMDNDGNLYTSVVVGGIEWLLQNLKTTKYRNGSSIPFVTNGAEWATKVESGLPDVCAWPGFSSSNQNFGLLYNWAAVQMGEVAPAGWRIPTEAEWAVLQTVASYPGSTCDLLKDWPGNCAGGQNASGYSLLESGDIYQTSAGEQAYWSNSGAKIWGATNVAKSGPAYARFQGVPGGVSFAVQYDSGTFPFLANGFGVRCVKENPAPTITVTYNSNGGSGTVPTDFTNYTIGSTATIKPNSGALVNGTSSFAGWTAGGITYACGQEVTITGNLTLSAKYSATEVMDNDGNLYTSMLIGGQRWLLQNLKTTKYRNGGDIPFVTSGTAWAAKVESGLPDVCAWPDFNSSNSDLGMFYNWAAVQLNEVAPAGWRIPTEAEWNALFSAVSSACDLISNWSGNCSGGQNSSGFSLFQSGNIYQTAEGEPAYYNNSGACVWGATNVAKSSPAYARFQGVPGGVGAWIYYDSGFNPFLANGFAIRCVKE